MTMLTKAEVEELFSEIIKFGTPTPQERKVLSEYLVQPTLTHALEFQLWAQDRSKSQGWRNIVRSVGYAMMTPGCELYAG